MSGYFENARGAMPFLRHDMLLYSRRLNLKNGWASFIDDDGRTWHNIRRDLLPDNETLR